MPVCVVEAKSLKKIYFVGIKGVGMTALALIAKEAGFIVSGSDIEEEFLTDEILQKNGITIHSGFSLDSFSGFIKDSNVLEILVITTAAHAGFDNPQCTFAKEKGIQVITHGQAVGVFMKGELFQRSFKGISVLGCHGKTTVTAMVATLLKEAGLDPSYAVGTSELFPLGNPGYLGTGEYFVAEADEFISEVTHDKTVKFLYQYPQIAIVNNIDFDHPDVYGDLEDVYQAFLAFVRENLLKNGTLIINGDDINCIRLTEEIKNIRTDLKIITFGEKLQNDIQMEKVIPMGWGSEFLLRIKRKDVGFQKVSVPGYHNVKNMLGVIALLGSLGVSQEEIKKIVPIFKGSKRRQEKLGETEKGLIIIDDYAHHPDEIEKTIDAVKKAFPEKKIIVIFQPHTVGRTKSLKTEFANSFKLSEHVLFLPVFSSKREGDIDYSDIYLEIENIMRKNGTNVEFFKDERTASESSFSPYFLKKYRSNVVQYALSKFNSEEYVLLTLGAGDVYKIAYDLADKP